MDFARPSQSIAAAVLSGLVLCNPAFAQHGGSPAARPGVVASPAVVTADASGISQPGDIQQVVGKQLRRSNRSSGGSTSSRSGGFLRGLFGRGSSDEDQVVPTPAGELQGGSDDVNWDGVPYHSVNRSNTRSSTQRLQSAATAVRPRSASPVRTPTVTPGGLQIPQPPAEVVAVAPPGYRGQSGQSERRGGGVVSSRMGSNDNVGSNGDNGSVGDDGSFSPVTSLRRSGRRVVTSVRGGTAEQTAGNEYENSDASGAAVGSRPRPDYSGVEDLVPRVKRRTIAAAVPATNSKQVNELNAATSKTAKPADTKSNVADRRGNAESGSAAGASADTAGASADTAVASADNRDRTGESAGSATGVSGGVAAGQTAAAPRPDSNSVIGQPQSSDGFDAVALQPAPAGRGEAKSSTTQQSASGRRYANLGFVGNGAAANAAGGADASGSATTPNSPAALPNRSAETPSQPSASPSVAARPAASQQFAADPFRRTPPAGGVASSQPVPSSNRSTANDVAVQPPIPTMQLPNRVPQMPTASPQLPTASLQLPTASLQLPTASLQLPDASMQFQSPYRTASTPIGSGLPAAPQTGTATADLPMPPTDPLPNLYSAAPQSGSVPLPSMAATEPAASIALAAPIAGSGGGSKTVLRDQMSTQHWNELPQTSAANQPLVQNQGRPANDPSALADNEMRNESTAQPNPAQPNPAQSEQNGVSSEMPGIRVTTMGPQWMMIRQTREYQIRVENRGVIDAEGVLVRTLIPNWAELQGNTTTLGEIEKESTESEERLVWTIDKLPAGKHETLTVRLSAARSGTYHMNVNWTLMPRKTVANVEVREPKLQLSIDGPDEVVYGESATYQVRILNPGDGVAPNVMFILSPDTAPQTQRIGDIPPGKEAQFDVELTAQDLKDLKVRGLATGDLDLRTEAGKTIKVLSAKLSSELNGPEVKYQDSEALYGLTISNNGTATSEAVVAQLKLPAGVDYIGGIENAKQFGRVLKWNIESLPLETAIDYEFRCLMKATGDQAFAFDAHGSAAGATEVSLSTAVESIADLVLSIKDPPAPAPIGSEVTYEIAIRNRGSRAAKQVRAVAQFSNGIEPKRILGQTGQMVTGQVLFDSIASIGPGEEVVLQVIAIAETGGHHRFRSEVTSGEVVLVAEEATHYMNGNTQRVSRRSGSLIR